MKSTTPGREPSPMKGSPWKQGPAGIGSVCLILPLKKSQGHVINLSPLGRLPVYSGESLGKEGVAQLWIGCLWMQMVSQDGSECTVEVTTSGMWVNEHWEGLAHWEANRDE